jgi:hypothetical protein
MILQRLLLNSIDSQGVTTNVAAFNLSQPSYQDRYIIRNISGLDATDLTPRLYGSGATGNNFYSMKQPPREVVLRIILNPQYGANETPESLRDGFYKAISAYRTSKVQLAFCENAVSTNAVLYGFITKLEAALFNQVPEVQLTIRCDYPLFRSPTRISVTGLTPSAPRIIDSVSTAPHGFQFVASFTQTQSYFQINKSVDLDWNFRISRLFYIGDILYFSSEDDNKYLYVMSNGGTGGARVRVELASYIRAQSVWPVIFPGVNDFQISPANITFNSLTHYETHWGV